MDGPSQFKGDRRLQRTAWRDQKHHSARSVMQCAGPVPARMIGEGGSACLKTHAEGCNSGIFSSF